jgi:hypothetical protein
MTDLPASWQTDPTGRHDHRYWDGTSWTENVADAGIAAIDPYDAAPTPEPEPEVAPEPTPGPTIDAPAPTTAPLGWSAPADPLEPEPEPVADTTPEPDPEPVPELDAPTEPSAPVTSSMGWGTVEPTAAPDPSAPVSPSGWGTPVAPTPPAEPEPAEPTEAAAPDPSGWASTPTAITPTVGGDAPTEVTPSVVPATGPTAFADHPTLPPPVAPGPPTVEGDDGGGGSGRRNLVIGVGILLVVALVAFLAIKGSDDDSQTSAIADRIVDAVNKDEPGIAKKDARCMAEHIVDEVGADRLKDVDFSSSTPQAGKLGNDLATAYANAVSACHVTLGGSSGGSSTTAGSGTTGGLPDIGDVDAFKKLMSDQYEATLGISHEKATCLADAMTQAIKDGKSDQLHAFSDFFDYLDLCQISLDQLRGAPTP